MSLENSLDAPFVCKINGADVKFPKLKLRAIGELLGKLRSIENERIRQMIGEKLQAEQRAKILAQSILPEFTIAELWNWAASFAGSIEVAKASLIQSGKTEDQASELVYELDPVTVNKVATHVVDHPVCRPQPDQSDEPKN